MVDIRVQALKDRVADYITAKTVAALSVARNSTVGKVSNYVAKKSVDAFCKMLPSKRDVAVYTAGSILGLYVFPWFVPTVVSMAAGAYLAKKADEACASVQNFNFSARMQALLARLWPNKEDLSYVVEKPALRLDTGAERRKHLEEFTPVEFTPVENEIVPATPVVVQEWAPDYTHSIPVSPVVIERPQAQAADEAAQAAENETALAFAQLEVESELPFLDLE